MNDRIKESPCTFFEVPAVADINSSVKIEPNTDFAREHEVRCTVNLNVADLLECSIPGTAAIVDVGKTPEVERIKNLVFTVDDDKLLRKIMTQMVKMMGKGDLEVRDFSDAAHALAEIRNSGKAPALIISDVDMPQLRGDQLCEELKSLDEKSRPFVVLVTGGILADNMTALMESGAYAALRKPFEMNDIRVVVREVMQIVNES